MMFQKSQLLALALVATSGLDVSASSSNRGVISAHNTRGIGANSQLGRHILSQARPINEDGSHRFLQDDADYSFVADYSIKFQGCHHVQQWNEYADEEDDVRVKTKRLVRFRLCEKSSCSNSNSAGCSSKFGDYVVDMNTFVAAYLEALDEESEEICSDANSECQTECNGNDDESDCLTTCYQSYGVSFCSDYYNNQNGNNNDDAAFDPSEYASCAQFDGAQGGRRRERALEQAAYDYYIGPYCADQGGEIHLGLFTDETCTTYAQNGESTFYSMMGYELPYSDDSLVSSRCFACGQNNGNNNNNNGAQVKDFCSSVYAYAGKCETRMDIGYPNESSCSYIEGIKIIREDGVIRTSSVKKSKAAAVFIGLFLTLAVLLLGYVYYLRTSKSMFFVSKIYIYIYLQNLCILICYRVIPFFFIQSLIEPRSILRLPLNPLLKEQPTSTNWSGASHCVATSSIKSTLFPSKEYVII